MSEPLDLEAIKKRAEASSRTAGEPISGEVWSTYVLRSQMDVPALVAEVERLREAPTKPGVVFCWEQPNDAYVACDRKADHEGPCSWAYPQ